MISRAALRIGLGIAGVIVAVVAVAIDSRALAWVAAVLLIGAVFVRLSARRN